MSCYRKNYEKGRKGGRTSEAHVLLLITRYSVAVNDKEDNQVIVFTHCHIAISASMHSFCLKLIAGIEESGEL